MSFEGLLLVDKSQGSTSFHIVSLLRRLTKERTIGHAGTLDPFATGVMVMLIGRKFTKLSSTFLEADKQYRAVLTLGVATDTYDREGKETARSAYIPSVSEVEAAVAAFQGETAQVPPMFSAKKQGGRKLCDLARAGVVVDRPAVPVRISIHSVRYSYPLLEMTVDCSKGTYIRSLAQDLGQVLGCGGHLSSLRRLRSGSFRLEDCVSQESLQDPMIDIRNFMISEL